MSTVPVWRRAAPRSAAGRAMAVAALLAAATMILGLAAAPLFSMVEDARDRADRLDRRAAALTAAAAARRAEAAIAPPAPAAIAAAEVWLDATAPVRDPDAAMLELVSALRLLAATAEVELVSAAPLAPARGRALFPALGAEGIGVVAAEARLTADHAGLARFLSAVEEARPTLRAAALSVTAASPRADREAARLSARVTVGALLREAE